MKIVATDVLGMVVSYLRTCGFDKAADYIQKKAKTEDVADVFALAHSIGEPVYQAFPYEGREGVPHFQRRVSVRPLIP